MSLASSIGVVQLPVLVDTRPIYLFNKGSTVYCYGDLCRRQMADGSSWFFYFILLA